MAVGVERGGETVLVSAPGDRRARGERVVRYRVWASLVWVGVEYGSISKVGRGQRSVAAGWLVGAGLFRSRCVYSFRVMPYYCVRSNGLGLTGPFFG